MSIVNRLVGAGIGFLTGGPGGAVAGALNGGGGGVQGTAAAGKQAIDAATQQGIQNQVKNAWDNVAVQAVNEASGVAQKATQA